MRDGELQMATLPLDLEGIAAELADAVPSPRHGPRGPGSDTFT